MYIQNTIKQFPFGKRKFLSMRNSTFSYQKLINTNMRAEALISGELSCAVERKYTTSHSTGRRYRLQACFLIIY